ncbi:MAG: hypothetical protein M1830_000655, partial [Pleopsidium flavum]
YRKAAHYNITHLRRQNFYALPSTHWKLLSSPPFSLLSTLDRVDAAIDVNANIADQILSTGLAAFKLPAPTAPPSSLNWHGAATATDLSKARTTIRQLYRDWSFGGARERRACYDPVLHDLTAEFAPHTHNKSGIRVLIPGAGLGRLVFEVSRAGFSAEGNEISYHALLAGSWVLNHTRRAQEWELFPFALGFSNLVSREHQLRSVWVPDVHPATALEEEDTEESAHEFERMSMTAADFVVLYGDEAHAGCYDAVATVFFVDTAPNLMRYVETIRHCLREGGVWINLGPLLWHFEESGPIGQAQDGSEREGVDMGRRRQEGIGEPGSVELTDEEVLLLVEKMGFKIEKHELRPAETGYIQDPESMLQNMYRVSHWVARKVS